MGYLSNANCLRLGVIRGWHNQRTTLSQKVINSASHILTQKFLFLHKLTRQIHDTELSSKTTYRAEKKNLTVKQLKQSQILLRRVVERRNKIFRLRSRLSRILNFNYRFVFFNLKKLIFKLKKTKQFNLLKEVIKILKTDYYFFLKIQKTIKKFLLKKKIFYL